MNEIVGRLESLPLTAGEEAELAYKAMVLAIEQSKSSETVISAALASIAAELRAQRKMVRGGW